MVAAAEVVVGWHHDMVDRADYGDAAGEIQTALGPATASCYYSVGYYFCVLDCPFLFPYSDFFVDSSIHALLHRH